MLACPNDLDGLKSFEPYWVRQDATFEASIVVNAGRTPDTITNAVAQIDEDGPAQIFGPFAGNESKLLLKAPKTLGLFDMIYDWDQDLGTGSACHGRDRNSVLVVEPKAKIGDPRSYRLAGRYRVRYSPYGSVARLTPSKWTLSPSCNYYGCKTKLRSDGGARGDLRLLDDGGYRYSATDPDTGLCKTEVVATGQIRTAKPAYNVKVRMSLAVKTSKMGTATTFTGKRTEEYSTNAKARAIGCDDTESSAEWKISGRRLP